MGGSHLAHLEERDCEYERTPTSQGWIGQKTSRQDRTLNLVKTVNKARAGTHARPRSLGVSQEVLELERKVNALTNALEQVQNDLGNIQRSLVQSRSLFHATEEDRQLFNRLVDEWHQGTDSALLALNRFSHPAYLSIIGMGWRAVPLMLQAMAEEPDHFGCALRAITREDPVRPEEAGDIEAIARAWLRWAATRGSSNGDSATAE